MSWLSWVLEALVATGLIYWAFRTLRSASDLRKLALAGQLAPEQVRPWLRRYSGALAVCLAVGVFGVLAPVEGWVAGLTYSIGMAAVAYVPIRVNLWMSARYWKLL